MSPSFCTAIRQVGHTVIQKRAIDQPKEQSNELLVEKYWLIGRCPDSKNFTFFTDSRCTDAYMQNRFDH